jgi:hypothetical protein
MSWLEQLFSRHPDNHLSVSAPKKMAGGLRFELANQSILSASGRVPANAAELPEVTPTK